MDKFNTMINLTPNIPEAALKPNNGDKINDKIVTIKDLIRTGFYENDNKCKEGGQGEFPGDEDSGNDHEGSSRTPDYHVNSAALELLADCLIALGLNPDNVRIKIASYLASKGDARTAIEKVLKHYFLEGLISEEDLDSILEEMFRRGLIGKDAYEMMKNHAAWLKGLRKRDAMGDTGGMKRQSAHWWTKLRR